MNPERYYVEFAAAFARGRLGVPSNVDDAGALDRGRAAGLRLHKFKRSMELPRVRRVLGILHGFAPDNLLDVGSGRGTFLWPLLDTFPMLPITAIDSDERRVRDLAAVSRGGVERLHALRMDATDLQLQAASFDVVTLLEVLEHLENPALAAAEAVRVARRVVLVSVPSKPDDNPEHIQLFDAPGLETLLLGAGALRVQIESVRSHFVAIASVGSRP